jgi:hypothetical protein
LLNEQVSPQGFIDEHLFGTKAGDLGAVLERGTTLEPESRLAEKFSPALD